jgi:Tol biopolymer transport system component
MGILLALIFSRTLPSRAGEMLTFVSNTATIHELRLVDLTRGLVHTVARSPSLLFRSPSWSPNGRWLAYVTEERQGLSELVVMSMDENHRFRLAGRGVGQFRPVWSPDGNQLAFVFAGRTFIRRQTDIYLLDARCALQLKPCENPLRNLTNTPMDEREPTWSPDGTHIAFVYDQDGQREIFVMDIDGANWVNLSRSQSEDFSPVWSPDGTRIAFVSDRARNYEIFVMDALTGDAVRNVSLNRAEEWSPSWSPDSNHLTFISDETGNYQLYLLTLDKRSIRNLTRHSSSDFSPAWSPDGKQIAFVSNRSEFQQVYLLNIDCSVTAEDCIRPITTTRIESSTPAWRP